MDERALGFSFAIGTPLDELTAAERRGQIEAVAAAGFSLVEWSARDARALDGKALGAELEAAGLGLAALGTGAAALRDRLSLSDPDAQVRARAGERVRAAIELAGSLGAPAVLGLIRGGRAGDDGDRERLAAALGRLGEHAAANATALVIEPINRYEVATLPTVDSVCLLLEEVGQPALRPMVDLFHVNIEEADPAAVLRERAGSIAYAHVADSNRLAPGEGHLDVAALLAELLEAGYDGPLVCETLPNPTQLESAVNCSRGLRAALAAGGF